MAAGSSGLLRDEDDEVEIDAGDEIEFEMEGEGACEILSNEQPESESYIRGRSVDGYKWALRNLGKSLY
jgi:hypothetical protein